MGGHLLAGLWEKWKDRRTGTELLTFTGDYHRSKRSRATHALQDARDAAGVGAVIRCRSLSNGTI